MHNQMQCEGDACHLVEVHWDGQTREYRFHNTGTRPVEIVLKGLAGLVCVALQPGETQVVDVLGFDYPYLANFR